jgi:predicted component of type VI protein secretion system
MTLFPLEAQGKRLDQWWFARSCRFKASDGHPLTLQSLEVRETHDIQRLCRLIEDCIRRFETRLKNISVTPLIEPGQERPLDRRLRFAIDAVLVAEPLREAVRLRSAVDAGSNAIIVEASG